MRKAGRAEKFPESIPNLKAYGYLFDDTESQPAPDDLCAMDSEEFMDGLSLTYLSAAAKVGDLSILLTYTGPTDEQGRSPMEVQKEIFEQLHLFPTDSESLSRLLIFLKNFNLAANTDVLAQNPEVIVPITQPITKRSA